MSSNRRLRITATLAAGLMVAGCGGSDESTRPSTSTTAALTPAVEEITTTTSSAIASTTSAGEATASLSIRDMREDLGIESIVLQPVEEGGPHPTLAWDPVDNAATYWVAVQDGSGRIYWAWTGAETQVRVGGGDRPELNQTAALHEPMTWSVTAVDDVGSIIAFSEVASVSP